MSGSPEPAGSTTDSTTLENTYLAPDVLTIVLTGAVLGLVFTSLVVCQAVFTLLYAASKSHRVFRYSIGTGCVLGVAILICLIGDVIETYGSHFGDVAFASTYSTFFCVYEALNGWMSGLVQATYAFRAWRLLESPMWLLPLFILPVVTALLWSYAGFSILAGVPPYSNPASNQLPYIWPLIVDIICMGLLLLGLWRIHARSAGSTPRGRTLLWQIAQISLGCNLLPTVLCGWQLINLYTNCIALYCLDPLICASYLWSLCSWLMLRQRLTNETDLAATSTPKLGDLAFHIDLPVVSLLHRSGVEEEMEKGQL